LQKPNWNWLKLIAVGRFLTSAAFFMYVGSLSVLIDIWSLSATEAGIIQTFCVIGFAISLFLSSYLCDYLNPSKILFFSVITNCLSSFLFYIFADNFYSALFLNFFIGCGQGGIYGPSIVLVSEKFTDKNKGLAMGSMLGGQAFGYAVSLSLSYILTTLVSYKFSFFICSLLTFIGAISMYVAFKNDLEKKYSPSKKKFKINTKPETKFLITGYTAHAVELFGLWTWLPIFLNLVILDKILISSIVLGIIIGFSIHASGVISSLISGYFSDKIGRKAILVFFSLISALLSFAMGWIVDFNWLVIIFIALAYSFFEIGDSSVLTAALTESIPKEFVGRTVGYRSILGIGLGSVTPGFFGFILDITNNHGPISNSTNWVYAFSFLGCAGLLATLCALQLKKK